MIPEHANREFSCLVIGAGIAGLTAARVLQVAGREVLVLDKGRGVGGRMATRRLEQAVFDHGAQFFTARDTGFQAHVQEWRDRGVVQAWASGFEATDGGQDAGEGPCYRGHPGMTAVAKALAGGLDVRSSMRVQALEIHDGCWQADTETGELFRGHAVVLTPPVPQSRQLLENGAVQMPPQITARLADIAYHPCLALLAVLDGPSQIPGPGGLHVRSGAVRWIADNQQKGISPGAPAVTIHAAPDFSRQHWDAADGVVADRLLAESAAWVQGSVRAFQIHRWRYSQPVEADLLENIVLAGPPPLVFAGDAFGGGRVEGAALSGRRAAERLLQDT